MHTLIILFELESGMTNSEVDFQSWRIGSEKEDTCSIPTGNNTVDIDGTLFSLIYVSLHLLVTENIRWKQNYLEVVTENMRSDAGVLGPLV